MIAEVVVIVCLAIFSTAAPIDSSHGGIVYGPSAASYAYHSAPVTALHTYAAPAPIIHAAPIVHAAPATTVYHAPAPIIHTAAAVTPILKKVVAAEPYDPNPQYSFSYGVTDHHTGDSKHAEESLVNGVVHGSYSLTEPDGSIRKVSYTADDHHGFNAVVEKKGVVKVAAAVAAAPAVIAHAAPAVIAHAAPAVIAHTAPAVYASGLDYHGYHH